MLVASFQVQSTVGKTRDALGWTIPPGGAATYSNWASQQSFTIGDTLVFNFITGFHDVAEVAQAAGYDPCTSNNTLSFNSTSPVTITLIRPGTHHYICTVIGHCQIGQKLTINVSRYRATATPPQSAPLSPSSPTGSPFPLPFSASPTGFGFLLLEYFD
ncbi:hypothetical protein L1987_01455 [Smallanthus sonchifolius]|uniref:Uncharacterized protein n=1 Tax=Smallanthus sonchifolius TaxID=185202 RepID=A0ACB9K567_9ASTR|nr:hypothetical protein L1987_01455 [Smallanthus sonchifolius]